MSNPHNLVPTRWPLNIESAEVTVRGVTPEGIVLQIHVPNIVFLPGDIALVEVTDPESNVRSINQVGPPKMFMLDLRGTLHKGEDSSLYSVSVDQPEDLERINIGNDAHPEVDSRFPDGWTDPRDWS